MSTDTSDTGSAPAEKPDALTINGERADELTYSRSPDGSVVSIQWHADDRVIAQGTLWGDALDKAIGPHNVATLRDGPISGRLVIELEPYTGTSSDVKQEKARSTAEARASEPVRAATVPAGTPDPVRTSPTPTENVASAADAPSPAADEAERLRRETLERAVRGRFNVDDRGVYRFRDGAQGIALRDGENTLRTPSDDGRSARAVAELADARGWSTMKVTGSKEFRREVWIEATARGIDVRGYQPTEQERERAEARAAERMPNAAEKVERAVPEVDRASAERKASSPAASVSAPARDARTPAADSSRSYEGHLVEHGPAPYRNDPEKSPSYFARISDESGTERVAWGVGIEKAIASSGVRIGERVSLEKNGETPVTAREPVRDEKGAVVGEREIATHRNEWTARSLDRDVERETIAAVGRAVADRVAKTPDARAALDRVLEERLDERAAAGPLPRVPIRDRRPGRVLEQGPSRDRDRAAEQEAGL